MRQEIETNVAVLARLHQDLIVLTVLMELNVALNTLKSSSAGREAVRHCYLTTFSL
jgi:hypothetical protein